MVKELEQAETALRATGNPRDPAFANIIAGVLEARGGDIGSNADKPLSTLSAEAPSKEKTEVSVDIVKAIMGQDFIGPEEVQRTYGRKVTEKELAQLLKPVTVEMLARGRELGAILSLRTGRTGDGKPITGQWMRQTLEPRLKEERKGRIFYNTDLYDKMDFFTQDGPRHDLALAFTTKNVIDGSTDVNYLEQTKSLVDFLQRKVFADQTLQPAYQDAITQFKNQKEELEQLLARDWRQAAAKLSQLAINQLARRTFPEAVYDWATYLQNTGTRLLPNNWDWTTSRASDDSLVDFGHSDADGAYVAGWAPDFSAPRLGVCASWVVSKI